jgi:nitrogen regulatory protein P-II 1
VKEIKAYIKPHKLSAVTLALHKIEGLSGLSVSNTRGFGQGGPREGRSAALRRQWISCQA